MYHASLKGFYILCPKQFRPVLSQSVYPPAVFSLPLCHVLPRYAP
ncbi:hypothetical protein EC990815_2665 [Escherichia coli 99.0815]|nr:hypothetical protein EC990815_2665 [Escherichia coli 99.0815]